MDDSMGVAVFSMDFNSIDKRDQLVRWLVDSWGPAVSFFRAFSRFETWQQDFGVLTLFLVQHEELCSVESKLSIACLLDFFFSSVWPRLFGPLEPSEPLCFRTCSDPYHRPCTVEAIRTFATLSCFLNVFRSVYDHPYDPESPLSSGIRVGSPLSSGIRV